MRVFALFNLLFFSISISFAQTNTVTTGNWNTGSTWSTGNVPGNGTTTNVNHALTLDRNLSPSGTYTINAPVTDPDGGTNYNLNVTGTLDVRANMKAGGTLQVDGQVTIRSGDTLTIGYPGSTANSAVGAFANITIEAGGVLIVNGNLETEIFGVIDCDGEIIVNGDFYAAGLSGVTGSGSMTTTGTMTSYDGFLGIGSSTIFGTTTNCNSGPCSGSSGCGVSTANNIVPTSTSVCSGISPGIINGTNHGGGATYSWESSTTSSSSGFSTIGGATSRTYTPGGLAGTTWYRRTVTAGGGACVSVSPVVQITVNTGSWNGATSTNWNIITNWCSGAVPVAATDVNIDAGVSNMPLVSTAGTCNNLIINSGATLTINGATLRVRGDLTINSGGTVLVSANTLRVDGNIIINSGGVLTNNSVVSARGDIMNDGSLTGTGQTRINGTGAQNISGSGFFENVRLNNTFGCTATSAITISGVLTLSSGVFTSNGNLHIDLNTGSIDGSGTGSIVGNITVTKTAYSNRYHYISSPLMSGMTVADWDDDVEIKTGSYSNLYFYDETVPSPVETDGWTGISSTATVLTPLTGYALFFNGPVTIDQTGLYTHGAVPSDVILTNTISSDATTDGWNLVGNPYPSTLDWNAASGWTKTNIGNAIYFWDPVNDRYASYVGGIGTNGGTRYIPSMQGFWVRASAAGGTGTFGMNNNVRVTNTNPTLWKIAAQSGTLVLKVKNGSYNDETIVRFRDDAGNSFDDQVDAYKLKNEGNTPSLYTRIGTDEYSINSLPDTSTNVTIPLYLEAALTGTYAISPVNEEGFDPSYELILEDLVADISHDLRAEDYSFTVNPEDTLGRFLLHFKKSDVTSTGNAQPANRVQVYSSEKTIYCGFNNITSTNAAIAIYSLHGRQITTIENADISSGLYTIDLPGEAGIYVVKLEVEGEVFTEKVFLK